MMSDDPISKVADDILALINSQPRTPFKSEIEDIIRLHIPYRPEGYTVTQDAWDTAIGQSILSTITSIGSGHPLSPCVAHTDGIHRWIRLGPAPASAGTHLDVCSCGLRIIV